MDELFKRNYFVNQDEDADFVEKEEEKELGEETEEPEEKKIEEEEDELYSPDSDGDISDEVF
jgi:hypothetical protein